MDFWPSICPDCGALGWVNGGFFAVDGGLAALVVMASVLLNIQPAGFFVVILGAVADGVFSVVDVDGDV